MQVTTDDVFVTSTFGIVFAAVARAARDGAKWFYAPTQECLATVIFVADDVTELLAMCDDVAD